MSGERMDAIDLLLEQMRAGGKFCQIASVRQTRDGGVSRRLRDGVILTAIRQEILATLVPPGATIDPDYVPVTLTACTEYGQCASAIMDIEDLKQFVNEAMVFIAEKERAIGRLRD